MRLRVFRTPHGMPQGSLQNITNVLYLRWIGLAWVIEFYRNDAGRDLITEFLDSLTPAQADKATRLLEMLEALGLDLTFPSVSHVKGPIFELRTQLGKANVRFLYAQVGGTQFLILLGVLKNTAKLRRGDIAQAESRLADWDERRKRRRKGVQP